MTTIQEIIERKYCNSKEEEEMVVNWFVKQHPFSRFDEIGNDLMYKLRNAPNDQDLFFLYTEYGPNTYNCMRGLYENPTNIKKIKEIGEYLNDTGGFETMQATYYLMKYFTPLNKFEILGIKHWFEMLNYYWHGIGKWKM